MAKAFIGLGAVTGTYADRAALTSPTPGMLFYQTDTDEYVKYATDVDGTARWMQADHDYNRSIVINGGFDVWQRGTSFAMNPASPYYTVDRWQTYRTGLALGGTFSRQASDLAGFTYFARMQRDSGNTGTADIAMATSFETTNVKRLQGKYLTLSFWARRGATLSSTSYNMVGAIYAGTGTDGSIGNGLTGQTAIASSTIPLTTTWKRYTVTTASTLLTTQNQLAVLLSFTPVGTAGATDYVDVAGVQLESGTAPSDFEYREYGEELRRCQRYYWRWSDGGNGYVALGTASTQSTTAGRLTITLPALMRSRPTGIAVGGSAFVAFPSGATCTLAMDRSSIYSAMLGITGGTYTSGGAQTVCGNGDATSWIEFTGAELL